MKDLKYDYSDSITWFIYRARVLLKKRTHEKLKKYDITSEQWIVLLIISLNKGINQKTLTKLSLKDRATITRILKILENKELITREKSQSDKREQIINLSDKGFELYKLLYEEMTENKEEVKSLFTEEEQKALISLLKKIQ